MPRYVSRLRMLERVAVDLRGTCEKNRAPSRAASSSNRRVPSLLTRSVSIGSAGRPAGWRGWPGDRCGRLEGAAAEARRYRGVQIGNAERFSSLAMFPTRPVRRLSRQTTSSPWAIRRSHKWEPTKPAPPATIVVIDTPPPPTFAWCSEAMFAGLSGCPTEPKSRKTEPRGRFAHNDDDRTTRLRLFVTPLAERRARGLNWTMRRSGVYLNLNLHVNSGQLQEDMDADRQTHSLASQLGSQIHPYPAIPIHEDSRPPRLPCYSMISPSFLRTARLLAESEARIYAQREAGQQPHQSATSAGAGERFRQGIKALGIH